MSEQWGPWIEHDGAGVSGLLPSTCELQIVYLGNGIAPEDEFVAKNWPGFYWRWKSVKTGWLSSKLRRVCDDPAYAPIIKYRIRKPRGLKILQGILEHLPDEVRA